jgi:hypothetical protein
MPLLVLGDVLAWDFVIGLGGQRLGADLGGAFAGCAFRGRRLKTAAALGRAVLRHGLLGRSDLCDERITPRDKRRRRLVPALSGVDRAADLAFYGAELSVEPGVLVLKFGACWPCWDRRRCGPAP